MSYNSHHNSRAQSREKCRRRGASSGQKTKRGIEGEDPAAAGIERFFSLKGPREDNNAFFSSKTQGITLREAALSLGHLDATAFDKLMDTKAMATPHEVPGGARAG